MTLPRIAAYPLPQSLPASRPAWRLKPDRAALLIHDMQRYFCEPFGQGSDPLQGATANMARLLQAARAVGVPVFYTAQKGDQFRPDRGLQADLWGPGMRAEAAHEEILPKLAPRPDEHVLLKHRYSAFQRSNLETLLRARQRRDQLIIAGIYAHIGCLCTAAEAFQRDIQPFAIADAQADFDRARHEMAMGWVGATCGIVTDTATALQALSGQADAT